jgi:hypothetical protein
MALWHSDKNVIRVRDDDIIGPTSSYHSALGRFQQIHEWIVETTPKMIHIPAILVNDIKAYEEGAAIRFVRDETEKGLMLPEVHGIEHIDYAKLDKAEVVKHLEECKTFIHNEFGRMPEYWYTPWGANAPHLYVAAKECNLTLIDCSKISKLQGRDGICQRLMNGAPISDFYGIEIFMHFWEGGSRLARVCKAVLHGSWEEAAKHNRQLFR